jgi:hypothetical protein
MSDNIRAWLSVILGYTAAFLVVRQMASGKGGGEAGLIILWLVLGLSFLLPSMILLSSIEDWLVRFVLRKSRDKHGDDK